MKVKEDDRKNCFIGLNSGDCYRTEESTNIFMKISSDVEINKNSVRLDNAKLVLHKSDTKVIPVDGTFVENYKE